MRPHLNLEARFKHFVVLALALAAFGSLFVTGAKAQNSKSTAPTWTITVIANGSKEKPQYSVFPTAGSSQCYNDENPSPTASTLTVCPDDIILWKAQTTSGKYKLYIFHEESYLKDVNGVYSQGFEDVNGQILATVGHDANGSYEHKYYVTVYDKVTKRLYLDDPKIMIGTGSRHALEKQIRQDCKKLHSMPERSKEEDQVAALCDKLDADGQTIQTSPPK
jgi:hypothetical protein